MRLHHKIMLLATAMLVLAGLTQAEEKAPKFLARVDFTGKGINLKPGTATSGKVSNVSWGKEEERSQKLVAQSAPLPMDKWTTITFTFTPEADGSVYMRLMSNWSKDKGKKGMNAYWVLYKSVTAEGAEIKNSDFSEQKDGKIKSWGASKENLYTIEDGEFKDAEIVKAWHNKGVVQTFTVKAGQEVKLTIVVKPFEYVPSDN